MPSRYLSAETTLTDVNPYLQGNFAPVRQGRDDRDFEVTGSIPPELNGGADTGDVNHVGFPTLQTTSTLTLWGRGVTYPLTNLTVVTGATRRPQGTPAALRPRRRPPPRGRSLPRSGRTGGRARDM